MRDPKRISRVLSLLSNKWRASPDMRLGQLLYNYLPIGGDSRLFYLEDDIVEALLLDDSHQVCNHTHRCTCHETNQKPEAVA